jgi:hypothetical protein
MKSGVGSYFIISLLLLLSVSAGEKTLSKGNPTPQRQPAGSQASGKAPQTGVGSKSASQSRVSYLDYSRARPVLEALRDRLPAELRSAGDGSEDRRAAIWQQWVARRDAEIRARLVQGDEDSLINFLLFGTSFSRHPRITLEVLARAGQDVNSSAASALLEALKLRAEDLIQGILAPGANERLLFARRLVELKGIDLKSPAAPPQLNTYLMSNLARVLNEQASYVRILESARSLGDASQEFAARSKLYTGRGLSSDTSLLPNFAIEKTLEEVKAKGVFAPNAIQRVAIVGPGLDFTDKQDGYDFYPQQTIQPFAIIDTLLRLGFSKANRLQITTLDLSPRINDHLLRSRQRASSGQSYTVQLPYDEQSRWQNELLAYWKRFGNQIGTEVAPAALPSAAGGLKVRAVRIRPGIVNQVTPQDLNIVLQHLDRPPAEGFDLVIATNILVYYDVFEQSLALANIERILKPGGLLLSNNALLELPHSKMHSLNYTTVVYSDKANDGDHIVWYQKDRR